MEKMDTLLAKSNPQHETSRPRSAWPGRSDQQFRLEILTKLMASKAPAAQTDPEMTLLVALEDTADLPCFWLDRAATHLRREDPGEFFPSSELIRRTAATLFRAARERATGLIDYSPHVGRLPLRASREIDTMHQGPEAVGLLAWSQKLLKG